MKEEYILAASQSPLFKYLTLDQVRHFLQNATTSIQEYKKNAFIAIAGEPMEGIGILLSGHAHLTRENILGQRSIMTDLKSPQMFGEVLLFTDNPCWPATIQTTTSCLVLFLPSTAFTELIPGSQPYQTQLLINLLHDLSEKALLLTRKVHYLTLKGMREKIFAYLIDLYKQQNKANPLLVPHSRQEMADVLNVSRTALSRELGRLSKEGILSFDKKKVTLLDLDTISDYEF